MNVLITGVAGSGKTTIANQLTDMGYAAYNMDSVEGLCAWVNLKTEEISPANRENDPDFLDANDWLWKKDKLMKLMSSEEDVYFCGSSGNQREMFELFDRVFLLEMTEELIKERILNNSRDHSYGQRPGEIEIILGYFEGLQKEAQDAGAVVIDGSKPLLEVVNLILTQPKN